MAIGNFDGMHQGHQAVVREAMSKAKALGCPAAVMSFYPHPRQYFAPHVPSLALQRLHERLEALAELGISHVYHVHFNRLFAELTAGAFVEQVLHGQLKARHVVTGDDFHYGKGREGNAARLQVDLERFSIGYSQAAAVSIRDARVSSSHIRRLLAEGDLSGAEAMLGRPFLMAGHVKQGDQRGRLLGFPTANLSLAAYTVPHHGVYVVTGKLAKEERWMRGVANIGVRPTFDGLSAPRLEAHFPGESGNWYGQRLQVRLHAFLRPEIRFDGMDALKTQIARDMDDAQRYWSQYP